MSLLLERNFPDLVASCCPDRIYALVFNHLGQAFKDNGSGVLVMTNYLKASHALFATTLLEDAQRSKYYSLNLDDSDFTLSETPMGLKYTVEYWRRPTTGTFNRDQDILEETRDLYWSGSPAGRIIESRLDTSQEERLAGREVHVVLGYDSTTNTVYGIAWLELNHVLQADAVNCNFQWKDYAGTVITDTTVTSIIPGTPGVFRFSQPATDLAPDRLGLLVATITDAQSVARVGVSGTNTWD